MALYAVTIFIAAFLLFQVQPLMGKYILPWFGGGPGVWTACMLFFQVLLLGGYAYAHFLCRALKPRAQAIVHLLLLAAALALLPITPRDSWKPAGSENPTVEILLLLAVNLGVPYFVLSATGPLLQQWFSRTHPGRSPYRLYALSNVGSLLALLSYPFYFETHFTRKTQAVIWAWGLGVYALGCGLCALNVWRSAVSSQWSVVSSGGAAVNAPRTTDHGPRTASLGPWPSALDHLLWLLLPACASVLLLAVTNKLCQDLAVIPFLWVLPLALYLLSFVVCFDSPRWYVRFPFTLALIVALGGLCWASFRGDSWPVGGLVAVYSGSMFICCMVCHGELYRLRPDPRHLTGFYLMIAAGGALGGFFVAVVAPIIFDAYYELQTGVLLCALLFLVACVRDRDPAEAKQWRWLGWTMPLVALGGLGWLLAYVAEVFGAPWKMWCLGVGLGLAAFLFVVIERAVHLARVSGAKRGAWAALTLVLVPWVVRKKLEQSRDWHVVACSWLSLGVVALTVAVWLQREKELEPVRFASRNFYGRLRVFEREKEKPNRHLFGLLHGHVSHGWQFAEPQRAAWPTLYYGPQSGAALAMTALAVSHRRIGLVGMGVGTLTAYAKTGDYVHIYEINPEVQRLATTWFTYLTDCPAKVEVTLGDARLSLERQPPQQFDLLVLDAFSSDAIPVHLLTEEAFAVYGRHLKTNGIIAVHISNYYLDLEPVLANLALRLNYEIAAIDSDRLPGQFWLRPSNWVLLARNREILNSPSIRDLARPARTDRTNVPLWTDDFTSLFQILK